MHHLNKSLNHQLHRREQICHRHSLHLPTLPRPAPISLDAPPQVPSMHKQQALVLRHWQRSPTTLSNSPRLSTSVWRFLPVTFLLPSKPYTSPFFQSFLPTDYQLRLPWVELTYPSFGALGHALHDSFAPRAPVFATYGSSCKRFNLVGNSLEACPIGILFSTDSR